MKQDSYNNISYLITGILSGISITSLLLTLQRNQSKKSKPKTKLVPFEFRQEQLSRTILYFNPTNIKNIKSSTIVIIGCYSTIGYECSIMLARNGVEHLHLIDIDGYDDDTDIGLRSRDIQEYIQGITSAYCNITMYKVSSIDQAVAILQTKFDYAIDATNTKQICKSKAKLIQTCLNKNIKIISTMDMNKSDPTRIHISDIQSASNDIIATGIRYHLKYNMDREDYKRYCCVTDDDSDTLLNVVYSSECSTIPLPSSSYDKTLSTTSKSILQSILGQCCASYALCQIGNTNYKPIEMTKRVGRHVRHKILQHFKSRYELTSNCKIDLDDVEFLMSSSCWNCKCAICHGASKTVNVGEGLELMCWFDDLNRFDIFNLVLVCNGCLDDVVNNGVDCLECDVVDRIERKLVWMKNMIVGDE